MANPIKFTSRDYAAILADLQAYLQTNYPQQWSDYFDSNIGIALMQMIAYVGDMLSFTIDKVSIEAFILTCQQRSNMLKHAYMLGYSPYFATAASVTARATVIPPGLSTYPATIAKGQKVAVGNVTFEVAQDYVINAGSSSIEITLEEGASQEDSITIPSDAGAWQTYTASAFPVIRDSWSVFVNGVEWTQVDAVETQTSVSKVYSIRMTGTGGLMIRFGDNVSGLAPAPGDTLLIRFRVGGGAQGNIAAHSITGSVNAIINGSSVPLYLDNANAASGGADLETIDHIRRLAPASVRTVDKCITAEDYVTHALAFSDAQLGTLARATARLRDGTILLKTSGGGSPANPLTVPAGTVVNVAGYGAYTTLTDMTLNSGNPNLVIDPNTVDVYVLAPTTNGTDGYPDLGVASSGLKQALLEHLVARSVVTATPVVRDPALKPVDLNLGTIVVDRAYDRAVVNDSILAAIADFFTDPDLDIGGSFFLSDFYNVIENVAGVLHFVEETPTGDVTALPTEMLVRGAITFTLEYPAIPAATSLSGRY